MSRMDRLNQQFKREISQMLLLGDISDPRVAFVSITYADISKDLSCAHIGFSVLTDDPQSVKSAQEGLNSARGRVRKLIGGKLSIRHIPEIKFVYDDSIRKAVSMDRMLEGIRREREERNEEKGADSGEKDP